MTILSYRPQELIENRKAVSDANNNTDDLRFANNRKKSSHGDAAAAVREKIDTLEIKRLCMANDTSELEEMLKEI